MLLLHIKEGTSFACPRSYSNTYATHKPYKGEALACGLLEIVTDWDKCWEEMQSTYLSLIHILYAGYVFVVQKGPKIICRKEFGTKKK